MGVGPSNLAILRADADIRKLEWSDIEDRLVFFRRWDMEDVVSAIKRFKAIRHVLDKARKPLHGDEARELLARRTTWEEFFCVCYEVETLRRRKLEDRERGGWHPACQSFAMLEDADALNEYDEFLLGDTVRVARKEREERC